MKNKRETGGRSHPLRLFTFVIFTIAVTLARGEQLRTLLNALNPSEISGELRPSATMAGAALLPGLFEGTVADRLLNGRTLKFSLFLSTNGMGYCELTGFDPHTLTTLLYLRGNYTNSPSGWIAGRFVSRGGSFRGRVNEARDGATLRCILSIGGRTHARRFVLTPARHHSTA